MRHGNGGQPRARADRYRWQGRSGSWCLCRLARFGNGLGYMGHHVGKHAAHMLVGGRVKNLLALPLRPQDAARAQQPQVMAYQRLRQMGAHSDVGDAARLLKASKYNLEPAGLAENPEQLGQLKDLIIGD
jgi:hypothetical protein